MWEPKIRATRFSFGFMAGVLLLVILLRLGTPLLAALFTYLALSRLELARRGGKWFAVTVLVLLLAAITYCAGYFVNQTIRALPDIADRSIPSIINTAKQYGFEPPFTDYDSLKEFAVETVKGEARYWSSFAKFARSAATQIVFLIAGCVVAISIFLNPRFDTGPNPVRSTLYSRCCDEIAERFRTLYRSFVMVMGAQVIISAINTVLTTIFAIAVGLPYPVVISGVTFLCGLVPVIGNLMSNTIVVAIGFTVSPKIALVALIFLVAIHKLEYLLNSKIVGWRIKNPLWLTLLALLLGERLIGLPGLVLAPVILSYVKVESSKVAPAPVPDEKRSPPLPSLATKDA